MVYEIPFLFLREPTKKRTEKNKKHVNIDNFFGCWLTRYFANTRADSRAKVKAASDLQRYHQVKPKGGGEAEGRYIVENGWGGPAFVICNHRFFDRIVYFKDIEGTNKSRKKTSLL